MRFNRCAAVLVASTLVPMAVEAGVPERVGERLDRAVNPSEPDEFRGSYNMTATTIVQHPNGKKREEVVFDVHVEIAADGTRTRQLLRFFENGEDMTDEKRQEFESADRTRKKKEGDDDDSDLANPFGETAELYQFGEAEHLGSEMIVDFGPAPGHEDDRNVAIGRLAWDAEKLDPTWLEMTAVHAPKPLKSLTLRLEFTPAGDQTFVTRMVTDGLAKVMMIQREFHTDLRFKDIRPASTAGR